MQWFIRTTDELRERIEQLYQLDGALQQLARLKSTVETVNERIEKDLRPTKVQHEMRLRALEPLLDQIDEHTLRLTKLEESVTELTPLAGDVTSAYGILRKNKAELDSLRADLKELRTTKTDSDDLKQIRAELTILKRMKTELDGLKGLPKELKELREKIPEPKQEMTLEEFADDLEHKLGKVFIAMQSDTSKEIESLKKKLSEQPKAEQLIKSMQPKFDESKAEIEKIYQLIAQVNISQSTQNTDFKEQKQQFLTRMEAKDEELKQLWQLFSDRIEKKEDEVRQLREQTNDFKAELELKDAAIHELQRHVELLSRRIAELESKPAPKPVKTKPVEQKPVEQKPVEQKPVEQKPVEQKPAPKAIPKPVTPSKITHFEIAAPNDAFFSGTPDQIKAKLDSASNIDELKQFLETSKSANNVVFMRSLDRHLKNLQTLVSTFDFSSDNVSIVNIKKYFDVFKQLLDNVVTICYRGLLRQPTFYQKFLEQFNRYLNRCGLYTRLVLPNAQLEARDLADMKITYRDTKDPSKKNQIAEVERLPYYIDYAASDGSTKSLFFEGKMTVYNA